MEDNYEQSTLREAYGSYDESCITAVLSPVLEDCHSGPAHINTHAHTHSHQCRS